MVSVSLCLSIRKKQRHKKPKNQGFLPTYECVHVIKAIKVTFHVVDRTCPKWAIHVVFYDGKIREVTSAKKHREPANSLKKGVSKKQPFEQNDWLLSTCKLKRIYLKHSLKCHCATVEHKKDTEMPILLRASNCVPTYLLWVTEESFSQMWTEISIINELSLVPRFFPTLLAKKIIS